jgi:hypothetical protein
MKSDVDNQIHLPIQADLGGINATNLSQERKGQAKINAAVIRVHGDSSL